jgi:hypothetical protein
VFTSLIAGISLADPAATRSISNIITHSEAGVQACTEAGAATALVSALRKAASETGQIVLSTLSKLALSSSEGLAACVAAGALTVLAAKLKEGSGDVQTDKLVLSTLSKLAQSSSEGLAACVAAGVLTVLAHKMKEGSGDVQTDATNATTTIMNSSPTGRSACVESGAFNALVMVHVEMIRGAHAATAVPSSDTVTKSALKQFEALSNTEENRSAYVAAGIVQALTTALGNVHRLLAHEESELKAKTLLLSTKRTEFDEDEANKANLQKHNYSSYSPSWRPMSPGAARVFRVRDQLKEDFDQMQKSCNVRIAELEAVISRCCGAFESLTDSLSVETESACFLAGVPAVMVGICNAPGQSRATISAVSVLREPSKVSIFALLSDIVVSNCSCSTLA